MKFLSKKEEEAYDYVIRANNEYFERINKAVKLEEGSDEYVTIIKDTMENVGKHFSIAEMMVEEAIKTIKDKKREQIFVDLKYNLEECRKDLQNLVFKPRSEMIDGDGTIEEYITMFEESLDELGK